MSDLEKMIEYVKSPKPSVVEVVISEHYGSEVHFLPCKQKIRIIEEGQELGEFLITAEWRATELLLIAKFCVQENIPPSDILDWAVEDVLRKKNLSYASAGLKENFGEVRTWEHYHSLEKHLEVYVSWWDAKRALQKAQDEELSLQIDVQIQLRGE